LKLHGDAAGESITFHDPCYLGRQYGTNSFCCGAGGSQLWKEEKYGGLAVNIARFKEAQTTGTNKLAVGCPFCILMLNNEFKEVKSDVEVLDIAEIVAAQIIE